MKNSFLEKLNRLNSENITLVEHLVNNLIDSQENQILSNELINIIFNLHIVGLSFHKEDYKRYSIKQIEAAIEKEKKAISQYFLSIRDKEIINAGFRHNIESVNYRLKELEEAEHILKESGELE